MDAGKLAYMANQIARNFAVSGESKAIAATAAHIRKFWDPRMKQAAAALVETADDRLSKPAMAALEQVVSGERVDES